MKKASVFIFIIFCILGLNARADSLCAVDACAPRVSKITGIMELLRGIEYKAPVSVASQTPDQAMQRLLAMRAHHAMDHESMDALTTVYAALGMLPADFNLDAVFGDINLSHARSIFDAPSNIVFITEPGKTPGWNSPIVKKAASRLDLDEADFILTRELSNALLNQNFDIDKLTLADRRNDDSALAARALAYGDAIMLQIDFLLKNTGINSLALKNPAQAIAQFAPLINLMDRQKLDALARVVRERITFPYLHGYEFALALRAEGGWPLVNAAYASPPLSTEQILHPEKYFTVRDVPVIIDLPQLSSAVGADYELLFDNVFGELGFRFMFDSLLKSQSEAFDAAAGWGGDRILAYKNKTTGKLLVVFFTTWDSAEDAQQFSDAVTRAFDSLNGSAPDRTYIRLIGRDVIVIHNADETQRGLIEPLLWRAAKMPAMVPPPRPVALNPDSFFFGEQIYLDLIAEMPPPEPRESRSWVIDGLKYNNVLQGYSITFPNDKWMYKPFTLGSQIITEFTAFHRGFAGSEITLEAFDPPLPDETDPLDDMIMFVSQQMGSFDIASRRDLTINGLPAREVVLTGYLVVPIKARFTEIIAPNKTYIFTCAAAAYIFSQIQDDFDSFINSFRLLN